MGQLLLLPHWGYTRLITGDREMWLISDAVAQSVQVLPPSPSGRSLPAVAFGVLVLVIGGLLIVRQKHEDDFIISVGILAVAIGGCLVGYFMRGFP